MTVILGGITSKFQIAAFDWTTNNYTRKTSRLIEARWLSSCAVLKDKHGSMSVAVVGGRYSSDLEAWNPEDGKVTTLAQLPPNNHTLYSPKLVPINDGSELLMYGGNYRSEIMKYSSLKNSWEKVKSMLGPKSSLVVLPVENLSCDGYPKIFP
jgi:hypothetical protein